jgi:hypothetical protein
MNTPIVLHLYDPKTNEQIYTATAYFVPWKMQKKAIRLYKAIGGKPVDDLQENDIDELSGFVMQLFQDPELTVEKLDDHADTSEMYAVIKAIVMKSKGLMDPMSPNSA